MNKKRIIYTALIAVPIVTAVTAAITRSYVLGLIVHIFIRLCTVGLMSFLMSKLFREQIPRSIKRAQCLCTAVLFAYFVILDNVREIVNGGVRTMLFLPLWLPLCLMIVFYYTAKDSSDDKRSYIKSMIFLGIPLTAVSIYIEILTFMGY